MECIPAKDLLQEPAKNLEAVLQVVLQKVHFGGGFGIFFHSHRGGILKFFDI